MLLRKVRLVGRNAVRAVHDYNGQCGLLGGIFWEVGFKDDITSNATQCGSPGSHVSGQSRSVVWNDLHCVSQGAVSTLKAAWSLHVVHTALGLCFELDFLNPHGEGILLLTSPVWLLVSD